MLSVEALKAILDYDGTSGLFTWKETRSSTCKKGQIAGTLNDNGYIIIGALGKRYRAHHLAWFYVYGELPQEIDHINKNKSDNRIDNLRLATRSQNNINTKPRKGKYPRGVMKNKNKYTAYIDKNYKRMYLGTYDTISEAKRIRDEKAKELYGEFAEI
mgnify:CR=1 FL=1